MSTAFTPTLIHLQCDKCKKQYHTVRRTAEDTNALLDREARGWWTCLNRRCMCPNCTVKWEAINRQPAGNGMNSWVHGRSDIGKSGDENVE